MDHFAVSDLTVDFLKSKIREQTSEEIKFSVDSLGNTGNEQIDLLKKYLEYYNRNVFYLPKNTPEEVIWDEEFSSMMAQSVLDNSKFMQYTQECSAVNSFKEKFSIYTKYMIGNNTSEDILNTQKIFIQKWVNAKNQDYQSLIEAINSIINNG